MEQRPKPRCVIDGEPWWDFAFSYRFEGREYGFEICARSADEAKARLSAMGLARFEGQCHGGPIPVSRGLMVPLLTAWMNWRRKP